MTSEMLAGVWAAVGVLIIAAATWLTAVIRSNTAAVQAHGTVVAALTRAAGTRVEGGTGAGALAPWPRPWPVWNQLADPDASGTLPANRWNDCGEECVAMILQEQHGVAVEADYLRWQLRGPTGPGQTTPADLVGLLRRNNVAAEASTPAAAGLPAVVQAALARRQAVVLLGHWISPSALHWIVAVDGDAAQFRANDPWGGVVRTFGWAQAQGLYAGALVIITRAPDPR